MKTYLAPVNEIEKKWYVVDARDKILGRLATEIAFRLRGKHKPTFSPFIDNGDFIIVTNADKIQLTGKKWDGDPISPTTELITFSPTGTALSRTAYLQNIASPSECFAVTAQTSGSLKIRWFDGKQWK